MKKSDGLTIEFTTEAFDYRSELSDEYNSGNQLYGKDVAEYLCTALEKFGVLGDIIDEDWGWLILAHEKTDTTIEICIYNWEADDSSASNQWRLRVTSYVHDRYLYFFRKSRNVQNSSNLVSALRNVFQGIEYNLTIFGISDDW
jgi:hypothetical protein